jgi:hypothetical protein
LGNWEGKTEAPTPQTESGQLSLLAALWADPDVRWLTGAHQADGHTYFIRERYEELLWWLLMPSLLALAGQNVPTVAAATALSRVVDAALTSAEAAGYRVDVLAGAKRDSSQPCTGAGSAKEFAEVEDPGAARPKS